MIEWKKVLPDTEFMFLVGPCHNCATVQSRILWADEDFMGATLADARKKGADSVAFHTVYELLSTDVPIERISQDHEVHMSMFNRPHLDAVVDFALGRKPDPERAARRYAERLDIALPDARRLAKLMKDISQVSMLSLQQTFITSSQEGYLHPYRASHYQEPFFYLNMSMANMEPRLPMAPRNSWLQRTHGLRNVPEDTQPIIDFVNPDVKKASRSPVWFARELRKVSKRALRLAVVLREKYPRPEFDTLLAGVRRKRNWAERVALEIEVALGLYPLFFGVSKARALSGLRRAADAIERILPLVKKGDPASVRRLPLSGVARPEEDLKATRQLLRAIEKGAFPFAAFQAFGRSLERYDEIRRTVRPNRQVPEALTRRIGRLLREAHQSARASEAKLEGSEYRKNVAAWREYLDEELAALVPPEMDVYPLSSLPAEEGFVRLRHDQCFRHGENAIEDFLGFFVGRDWWPRRELFFRLAWDDKGLWVALKEDGADMSARRELWDKYAGSLSDSYFLRVSVDREGAGRKFLEWRIMSKARDVRVVSLEILGRQHTRSSLQRPFGEGKVRWRETPNGYRLDYSIPWHALRGKPQRGESWRLNITANPYIARNHQTCWCAGYEYRLGKSSRMGKITFVRD